MKYIPPEHVSIALLAKRAGLSETRISGLIREGKITAVRFKSRRCRLLISEAEAERFIADRVRPLLEEFETIAALAKRAGVSESLIRSHFRNGRLACTRVDGKPRIHRVEADRWIESRSVKS